MARFTTVADYLASFPPEVRAVLERIRAIALEEVPDGEDAIRYDIATVVAQGRSVVHYAGWQRHVSLYPVPDGDEELAAALAPHVAGKGTLKFGLADPLPEDLVRRVVRALVQRDG
jgi:uncharacterized protein YdhG (YjbR/CyaY superfamily)